jgi:RimJ/RimL family protein N-acetyltransferase
MEDAIELQRAWSSAAVFQHLKLPVHPNESVRATEELIDYMLNSKTERNWTIRLRNAGAVTGVASLTFLPPRACEISLLIGGPYQRKGIGRNASALMISFAIDKLRATDIFAGTRPANEGARRLLASLGFVKRGRVPVTERADEEAFVGFAHFWDREACRFKMPSS